MPILDQLSDRAGRILPPDASRDRRTSLEPFSDADAASFCSSPSSVKVRLRNTFLEFKDEAEFPSMDAPDSPSADGLDPYDCVGLGASPLRRSQSDCIGVDDYIRERLGSNAGLPTETVEIDTDTLLTHDDRLSPMSALARRAKDGAGVSILSFSPPNFQASPFAEPPNRSGVPSSDFVMVMEEDPHHQFKRNPNVSMGTVISSGSTHSGTPHRVAAPIVRDTQYSREVYPTEMRTTVMLRNIPNKYTQRMLLEQLNKMGYEGMYDFFYLPIDFRNKCNVGYAFINFLSSDVALRFKKQFDGYRLTGFNSQKICEVSFARVQGLHSNIQHYRNSPVNGIAVPEYRPLVFADGVEVPFPLVVKSEFSFS